MPKTTSKAASGSEFLDILKSMQATMPVAPFVGPQIEQFWDAQDKILNETQRFTAHWFARRHQAVQSSLGAARTVTTGNLTDPMTALSLISDWQMGSAERLSEDARDWFETVSRCAEYATKTEAETLEKTTDMVGKATKSAKSAPV